MVKNIKNSWNLEKMGIEQGLNFIDEIYERNPLGTQEDTTFKEVMYKIRLLRKEQEKVLKSWDIVEDNLTQKQLLRIWNKL